MPDALLVAGPVGLSSDPEEPRLLAGAGFLAAAAAAALSPVQLWARAGADFDHQHREVFARRRIDPAGLGEEGPSARLPGPRADDVLPAIEPVDASELGAVLLIDLPPRESTRALGVASALPGGAGRPLLIAPPVDTDGAALEALAARATVLVYGAKAAAQALGQDDPVACGQRLIDAGATTVLLTHGPFGGLSFYKHKVVSWPTLPRPGGDEAPGVARAIFAGVVAAEVAHFGRVDYRHLKRFLATASAVASEAGRSSSPKKLMALGREDYQQLFQRLRRNAKY